MSFHMRIGRGLAAGLVAAGDGARRVARRRRRRTVRVALGDVVSEETLAFIVALERAKERGVDYELTSFAEEELAIQAIVGGQTDLGIGTPYSVIQKTKVPLRAIFQMSALVFFPVVSTEYKTWKDLNGQPFTFHARGTATEAYGDVIAAREGIEFGERSYVPGSGNRVIALLNGTIKATILDLANKNKVLEQAPDKFHVLPGVEERVSDEILFANAEWLDGQPGDGDDRRRGAPEALARDERESRRSSRRSAPSATCSPTSRRRSSRKCRTITRRASRPASGIRKAPARRSPRATSPSTSTPASSKARPTA